MPSKIPVRVGRRPASAADLNENTTRSSSIPLAHTSCTNAVPSFRSLSRQELASSPRWHEHRVPPLTLLQRSRPKHDRTASSGHDDGACCARAICVPAIAPRLHEQRSPPRARLQCTRPIHAVRRKPAATVPTLSSFFTGEGRSAVLTVVSEASMTSDKHEEMKSPQ